MNDKEKIMILKQAYDNILWMAIRYAHGRNTYAPDLVKDSVKAFKEVFPEWNPKQDKTIDPLLRDNDDLYNLVNQ